MRAGESALRTAWSVAKLDGIGGVDLISNRLAPGLVGPKPPPEDRRESEKAHYKVGFFFFAFANGNKALQGKRRVVPTSFRTFWRVRHGKECDAKDRMRVEALSGRYPWRRDWSVTFLP